MPPMVAAPLCAVCGSASARVELVAPGGRPVAWDQRGREHKDAWLAAALGR